MSIQLIGEPRPLNEPADFRRDTNGYGLDVDQERHESASMLNSVLEDGFLSENEGCPRNRSERPTDQERHAPRSSSDSARGPTSHLTSLAFSSTNGSVSSVSHTGSRGKANKWVRFQIAKEPEYKNPMLDRGENKAVQRCS